MASRKTACAPSGTTTGTPRLEEEAAEEGGLADVVTDVALVERLADALGERLHVVPGHAAVVREPLVDDDQLAGPVRDGVVVQGEEPADRDEVVLLRGEDGAVGQVAISRTIDAIVRFS